MGSDIVRLPSGKVITRGRAIALGLLDANGDVRADAPADSQAEKVLAKDARAAQWTATQRIGEEQAALTRGQKAAATRAANKAKAKVGADGEPEVTSDGLPNAPVRKKIEPLRPQNVDHDGQPVTDEATLAAIAAAAAGAAAAEESNAVSISVEDGEVKFTDIPGDGDADGEHPNEQDDLGGADGF